MRFIGRRLRLVAISIAISIALSIATTAAGAGHDHEVQDASAAATAWLALIDSGRYQESWEDAATIFQGAVSKAAWAEKADVVRAPFGALKTRELKDAQWTSTLPGAPDGEYVVIHFRSAFANKADAIETVTPMKGSDGRWHVSGYFVR